METRRWVNQSQPQTLYIATFLLYFNAFFGLLAIGSPFGLMFGLMALAGVPAGYGIANEQRWGYVLGIAVAVAPFILRIMYFGSPLAANLITVMFDIALVVLLVHPQSRDYQRIWFK